MVKVFINFVDIGSVEREANRVRVIITKIEAELDPEVERILTEAAIRMRELAKTYVRVDTGSLRRSIRIERKAKHHLAVRAGGFITNPKSHRIVDYQSIIEAKYPYLQPAYDQVLPMLDAEIDDLMLRLTEGY